MRHNLGNFPHHQKTNKPKSKNAGKRTCYAVYEDWFEGFEKKNRDFLRVRSIEVWLDYGHSLGLTAPDAIRLFIKEEVLGDAEK